VGLQVRAVLSVTAGSVLFQANPMDDPTVLNVHRWRASGLEALTPEPGVHTGLQGGGTVVVRTASLTHDGIRTKVSSGPTITSYAEAPLVDPRPHLIRGGKRALAIAVLLPAGSNPDDASVKLPVLLDPYGGPHAQ